MVINYFGEGCFRVENGKISILVDPVGSRLKGDITLRTIVPSSFVSASPFEVGFPGEYEIKGVEILGLELLTESTEKFLKTVYLVNWEDIRLGFLGHTSKILDSEILEKFGEVDVLFMPAGAPHFLSLEAAVKIARQIEPAVIIPSFYKNAAEVFKAFGQKGETKNKFVFKKKDLSVGKKHVIVLERDSHSSV